MSEVDGYTVSSIFQDNSQDSIQAALETGNRAYEMLVRIMDYLKVEVGHERDGGTLSPSDFLNKIVGLAHEYDLPQIREKALGYQETGR